MKFKLLALDIDGTILNSASQLTPRTIAAVQKAQERGIKVVLATGRRLGNTLPLVEALGVRELLVVHNGVVVADPVGRRALVQSGICPSVAEEIVDKLEAWSVNYIVYTGESAGEKVLAPSGRWQEPENLLSHYLGEAAEFAEKIKITSPPVRLAIIDLPAKVDPLYAEIKRDYAGQVSALLFGAVRDAWRGIELLPAHSNKGVGVAYVAERLGISPAETVAVGDNINDLEMILWAGLGVAMENGSPLLKEKAAMIAPSNDQDGAAFIIEELLLGGAKM